MRLSEFYELEKKERQFVSNSEDKKIQELTLILDVIRKINSSLKLDEVLKSVLSSALKLTNTWRGFIVLKNSNDRLVFKLGRDRFGLELFESSFSVSDLVIRDVFESGEAVIIAGAENTQESRYLNNCTIVPIQTIFCAPLIVEGTKIGVVYVDCNKPREIKKVDVAYTFEILTEQAAIAINNALIHEELEKEHRKTENAEKLKDNLLTLISHEFRNPLNFIMTHAKLLQDFIDGSIDKEYVESFEIINRGTVRLLRSVELVMNTSEINSGNYELRKEEINIIESILKPIKHENENTAYNKNIDIVLNNKLKGKPLVKCDKQSLVLIFAHLIDNAVKFTEKGKVTIDVYREPKTDKISVEIGDTGIGIDEEYLPNVFEQFTQEESGYTRRYDGMGLGLALVKSYCDLNNLKISVKSKKRLGSQFKVEFNQ